MASKRAPLANNPNAANSPYRAVAAAATKRSRSHAGDQREIPYGQPPPAKKQLVSVDDEENRRNTLLKKVNNNQPTTLRQKLEAARDSRSPQKQEKPQKASGQNLETIRQWQKHYRKVFPQFVFYFESIPEDGRHKISRQVLSLGAREEKFFSRAVTHVVTSRPVPPETDSSSSGKVPSPNAGDVKEQPKTINPSLLDQSQQKNRFTFEVPSQRRAPAFQAPAPMYFSRLEDLLTHEANVDRIFQDAEARRTGATSGDILHRAREFGMKIWTQEKVQRMMTTLFDTDTGEQAQHINPPRANRMPARIPKEADLQLLLQNEKVNGPADRDPTVTTQDMVPLRGYYIYIHDMDEKTRPVMVRDYPKAAKEDGKWPQLRATGPGRCPFVEDSTSRPMKVPRNAQPAQSAHANLEAHVAAPRTRAAIALDAAKAGMNGTQRALTENSNFARRPANAAIQPALRGMVKPLDPPQIIPNKRANTMDSMPPLFGSAQASLRTLPRFAQGEPVASGVQPSNVTSAIRSQMISSTAAAPGARAGTSKEVNQLKRKILEKHSAPSANSMPSSYMNDVRAAINNERGPPPRAAKRKAQESLANIREDVTPSEEELHAKKLAAVAARKKKQAEKELKPGYCENCREKFNDFDEHCLSRKHRKFALADENWKDLDGLLGQLVRVKK
ncbi:hypothetical protein K402DRAFT_405725 [Aulographum hederae CBS 113979]|uniref:DBF4-type domain-containing protein n=1 Tax=Aulographum hederae CBS 113979 TaxID=1176131 RepID=A0A6G1GVX8_9PEZI|nr:hypothetical protein K402DRAFT_405725 [Aulographum hederae CBS 113979]